MNKRHYLHINRGFISVYALIVLQLVFFVISLFTLRIMTLSHIVKRADVIDLYIIQSLKDKLSSDEYDEQTVEFEEDETMDDIDEEDSEKTWTQAYQETLIMFHQQENIIYISYMMYGRNLQIRCEINDEKEIMGYEYI